MEALVTGGLCTVFGVVIAAALALVVVSVILNSHRERRRHDALRVWAKHHGWYLREQPPVDWADRLPGRNPRGVSLSVHGTVDGRTVTVAEYSYTTSSTDAHGNSTSETHRFVVTAVRLPTMYPTLSIERRSGLSKLGRAVFGDAATAIGDERFDRMYRIRTVVPVQVHSVLSPALVSEHIAGRVPVWSVQGTELLSYRKGRIEAPEQIPALAAPLVRVAELLQS
ncbi:hypothetical protein Val02_41670 [Virgisporangium aliadipatigenens]|uniref:Uncharacterized protein n=1 Tax=Virgisporangium aliadipatigenens TaxID=741659 RepID=A0A8J3YLB4_9ACTN|nr:hypothetical protein [Virgisporangium aliadipatigenens]GIJ47281.1 hypothetical protein Val02_41670 [Virgisporangium aliadipatigenens]